MSRGQILTAVASLMVLVSHAVSNGSTVSLAMRSAGPAKKPEQSLGVLTHSKLMGRLAPEFSLRLRNGDTFRLQDELGKHIIVLDFFTTWCVPCREEMPTLERYYNDHKNGGILLVGIDVREKPQPVDDLISGSHISFPVGIDSGTIQNQYMAYAFPTTIVISLDKRVRFYHAGDLDNPSKTLDRVLNGK